MARKSRSKQRSKGAGTRSGSAGGKSQGGGRSSAGKGKSQGGSGKSSSKGKSSSSKGKSSSSKGKSSNKGGSGGRNNPSTNKRPSPKPTPKKVVKAPAPKAPAPKAKAPTPKQTPKKQPAPKQTVQQRFKEREAKGLDGLTGMRKVTDAERKEGKTQLTQYRAAQKEQVRNAAIARNAANVTGIPSGDNLKAGSFSISEEGKALAAQQRAEAAAKKAAERKAADEKLARQFNPARLSPQEQVASATSASFTNPAVQNFGQNFGNWYNLGKNTRIPNEATAKYGKIGDLFARDTSKVDARTLFGDDRLQRGMSNRAFKEGKQSNIFGRPDRAFGVDLAESFKQKKFVKVPAAEGGPMSGPTPVQRRLISDALSIGKFIANPKLGVLAALAKPTALADGTLTGNQARVEAGGLNIGGSAQASEGGVDSGDPTARVSGFKSVRPLGIAKEALQGFGDVLTGQQTDFDKLGRLGFGATTDKLKDAAANMRINEVTDTLKKSPIRQAAVGFNYGIDVPDAIKQVDETRSVLNKTFKDFKGKDIDLGNIKPGSLDKNVRAEDLRGGISNVAYNLDRMPTLARGLSAFQKDTEGGGDKEFRKDLRFTFNRKVDAPTGVPGRDLMKATTPGIVNRVLSGKVKDMGQEAITQNNLTGGMTADKFDTIASTLNKNLKTEGTIANTRKKELTALAERFGPGGGQAPTPKSILKGVNPFRGSNRGGGGTPIRSATPTFTPSGGGGGTPVGQVPQVPPTTEFQVPEIPQQQGLDAGNLANIQNESYQNTFKNLMAMKPNYAARFQMRRRRGGRRGSFKRSFSRRFFS